MKSLKKGFTLVELMVVIVIIGILAALAIPRFLGATNKTKATEFKPILKQIYTLEEAYKQENPSGKYGTLQAIGFDSPGANAYFNYGQGKNVVTADGQVDAMTATVVDPATGGSVASAHPNNNGVKIYGFVAGVKTALVNGTDMACITDSGTIYAAGTALQSLAGGSVTAAACP